MRGSYSATLQPNGQRVAVRAQLDVDEDFELRACFGLLIWTVPQSIVRNEYLPALAQDPTVLERMGLRVSYNGDGVTITQPPGDGNALGRVRFNFNNRFSVFQHDTPDKSLFGHEVRAYSHGCMRVQDPAKYAEVLLNIARPNERWTAERITRMYGGSEQNLQI